MALNTQELLAKVVKVPLQQKLIVVGVMVCLITGLNFYLEIGPLRETITQREAEHETLEKDLIQKQSIANNLAQFRHEKEILERKLAQALTELPNEANIDDLIRSFSEVGNKSGLIINTIEPQAEMDFDAAVTAELAAVDFVDVRGQEAAKRATSSIFTRK